MSLPEAVLRIVQVSGSDHRRALRRVAIRGLASCEKPSTFLASVVNQVECTFTRVELESRELRRRKDCLSEELRVMAEVKRPWGAVGAWLLRIL